MEPSLPQLTQLFLSFCGKCQCLPPLGDLPLLERLEIEWMGQVKYVVFGIVTEVFVFVDVELWLSFWSEVHYNSLYASGDVPSRAPRKRHSPAQDHLFSVPIPSPC
ncbi:unnamed protein product, partial [Vitis vinifera]